MRSPFKWIVNNELRLINTVKGAMLNQLYLDFDSNQLVPPFVDFWDLNLELGAFGLNVQRFCRDENVFSVKYDSVLNRKKW